MLVIFRVFLEFFRPIGIITSFRNSSTVSSDIAPKEFFIDYPPLQYNPILN